MNLVREAVNLSYVSHQMSLCLPTNSHKQTNSHACLFILQLGAKFAENIYDPQLPNHLSSFIGTLTIHNTQTRKALTNAMALPLWFTCPSDMTELEKNGHLHQLLWWTEIRDVFCAGGREKVLGGRRLGSNKWQMLCTKKLFVILCIYVCLN